MLKDYFLKLKDYKNGGGESANDLNPLHSYGGLFL